MAHYDAFISDVVIIIDDVHYPFESMVEKLATAGVMEMKVRPDQHVIEGSVDSSKLREIDEMPGVEYVRAVFTYSADFPEEDPRNLGARQHTHQPENVRPSWNHAENRGRYRKI